MSRNIAVILAGGSGSRLGRDCPKQFLKVAGKKIIEHTLDVFEKHPSIDEIAIVSRVDYQSDLENMILQNGYKKVKKILVGGKERYHSSLSAIYAYDNDDDNLIFHDAVRPLVNNRIIDDCIEALRTYQAVDVAVKTTDTIIEVGEKACIEHIADRSKLYNGQTPQCFKRGVIYQAYLLALKDPQFKTTDDCGVVKKYLPDIPIYVVRGETFNMKVTYIEDLFLLDKLFQLKAIQANDHNVNKDTQHSLQDKVVVVFGGSYGIGADVVAQAKLYGAQVIAYSRSLNGVDVTNVEHVRVALRNVAQQYGGIDYIVCSAGVLIKEPLASMSYEDIERSIVTNYTGCVNVAKEGYAFLKARQGSLLFYTSSSYTRGRMMYSVYSSTKAAIVNLTQALSEEWAIDKIRVNCINPERCDTPMRRKNFGIEPEGTLLDPLVVANVSLNVLASMFTGEVIDVKIK